MRLEENIPLAPLTTFRLGGPARFFVEAKSIGEVQEAVALAQSKHVPLFVLGGGSNLLVADAGWPLETTVKFARVTPPSLLLQAPPTNAAVQATSVTVKEPPGSTGLACTTISSPMIPPVTV